MVYKPEDDPHFAERIERVRRSLSEERDDEGEMIMAITLAAPYWFWRMHCKRETAEVGFSRLTPIWTLVVFALAGLTVVNDSPIGSVMTGGMVGLLIVHQGLSYRYRSRRWKEFQALFPPEVRDKLR